MVILSQRAHVNSPAIAVIEVSSRRGGSDPCAIMASHEP